MNELNVNELNLGVTQRMYRVCIMINQDHEALENMSSEDSNQGEKEYDRKVLYLQSITTLNNEDTLSVGIPGPAHLIITDSIPYLSKAMRNVPAASKARKKYILLGDTNTAGDLGDPNHVHILPFHSSHELIDLVREHREELGFKNPD